MRDPTLVWEAEQAKFHRAAWNDFRLVKNGVRLGSICLGIVYGASAWAVMAAESVVSPHSETPSAVGVMQTDVRILSVYGERVYLSGGKVQGLGTGMRLRVEGQPGVELELLQVGDQRASARRIRVGEGAAPGSVKASGAERAASKDEGLKGARVLLPGVDPAVGNRTVVRTQGPVSGQSPAEGRAGARPGLAKAEPQALRTVWQEALAIDRLELREFSGKTSALSLGVHGGAETGLMFANASPTLLGGRMEQRLALWADVLDVGMRGLDVRLRAELDIRYDDMLDRYVAGGRALPLVREAAVRYGVPRKPLHAVAGRFKPGVRQADVVDGLELSFVRGPIVLSAFGGLKPSSLELLPRGDRPVAGLALSLTPRWEAVRYTGQLGYSLDVVEGGLARQTLATDHHLKAGNLRVNQSITLDMLASGVSTGTIQGLDLGEASLGLAYSLGKTLELKLRGRTSSRELLAADALELSPAWVEALSGRERSRLDAGVQWAPGARGSVEPYVYYRSDQVGSDSYASLAILGGGLRLSRAHVRGGPLRLDLQGEYSDGTTQQATLLASLAGPLADHRLQLHAGSILGWTFGHLSGNHTAQALLHLQLDGSLPSGLTLYASGLAGVDALVGAAAVAPTGMASLEAGAGWRF